MYEANRKPSRETCASSPSPASSPLTPSLDAPPAEPLFAEYDKQSATLDSIGAWSAVQPNHVAQSASQASPYRLAADMHSLSSKYGGMRLNHYNLPSASEQHGQHGHLRASAVAAAAADNANADADVDYTELDEAILRGRSTTLPNIFAVTNPLYRFSTIPAMDSSASPGPISPVSNSTFSMLSRHGSMSITNSNRTVSPLGLPLHANPIHQSASLDNHRAPSLEPGLQLNGSSAMSHAPVRRFSEYSAEPSSYLSLSSYSMAPHFDPYCDAVALQPNAVTAAINSSGASHVGAARAAFAPSSISSATNTAASASAATRQIAQPDSLEPKPTIGGSSLNGRVDNSAYVPVTTSRHGMFAYHLPTMSEEAPQSPPTFAESVLMRNMSCSAMPMPPPPDGMTTSTGDPFLFARVSSPLVVRDAIGDPTATMTELLSDKDGGPNGSYLPLRVKSLKDLRRPSLETRGNYALDYPADDQAAAALFERAAALQPSMALNHLSGIGRRHSLAGSSLCMPTPVNSVSVTHKRMDAGSNADAGPRSTGRPVPGYEFGRDTALSTTSNPADYSGCPAYMIPSSGPPGHGAAYAMRSYGSRSGQQQLPPTNSSLVLVPMAAQQQYHHNIAAPYNPYAMGLDPLAQVVGGTPASGGLAHHAASANGAAPHSGAHPLLPNPATTITPNMPFADMGKGLAYSSLPKGTRVFVVKFKGKRCDLYFVPDKGMEPKIIPTMAPSALPIPSSAAPPEPSRQLGSNYEPGAYVLVEADRGVDLGMITEELVTADSILSFSSTVSEAACTDHLTHDGRRSAAPAEADCTEERAGPTASPSSKDVYVKRIFRVADQREVADLTSNKVMDEQKALSMCQDRVQQRKLSMHVADAEFQFDRRKLTFYFTADRRVDFRELVRELFKHFKTRIWMCQQTH
ncbi:hypothetical protein EV174_000634 [Coemansia sp. RSA 2320]|nr:hypothetical protein EV174_000634 [Coemansia sp. RSA 2320]